MSLQLRSRAGTATTERDLREQIRSLCKLFGWKLAFTQYSIRSPKGYPDLCLVRPPRVVFAELKSAKGTLTSDQEAWITALRSCPGVEVFVWRPADLDEITHTLARTPR